MTAHTPIRIEAALKVTGRATYPAEIPVENMLHATLIEATIGNGEVLAIDPTLASQTPGFADFVSYPEAETLKRSSMIALIREKTIHFVGQPIALVAAETLLTARTAARAVQVEYRSAQAVTELDPANAYTPPMAGRIPAESQRGDAASAIASADLVVRNRFATAVNNHHPMEPHAIVCWWDGDQVVVHTTTQAVFGTRAGIAHCFDMPAENIRVITKFLGGGFGCKGQLWWPWMMLAMLAAKRTGRPVRLELTRAQLFTLVGRRQATIQDLALGFSADGKLAGIEHDVLAQTSTHGEYSDTTAGVSRWLYSCANVTTRHRLVRTNEPQPIPMRAPGAAPGSFAMESAFDEAAERLGLDPIDLRARNFAARDEDGDRPWSSNSLLECTRVGAERFGWARRPTGPTRDGRWLVGTGMASTFYRQRWQAAKVRVALASDASLLVQCGTQDMGSGTYTMLGQMAASVLGIAMSDVTVELGDTWLPEGPISAGSQVTLSIAPAVAMAAQALRDRLADIVGHPVDDLIFADGMIRGRTSNLAEKIADLMMRHAPDGIEANGTTDAPPAAGETHSSMGYGAIFVEVGVDPDLGEIRVRRVTGAFAAGRIINPLLARSQYVGGLIGGIGMALHEATVTDAASGRILGAGFADYLIPVHADMPDFDIAMIDESDPYLPGGIKGVGMLGSAGVQAAIANAIYQAVGKRIRHLPIRIEDIIGS